MMESTMNPPFTRSRWRRAGRALAVLSILFFLLSFPVYLSGCASLRGGATTQGSSRQARAFDPSLLRQGMSMAEVQRLEGRPRRTYRTTSRSMSVTEWIYESRGERVTVYFANGLLESWSR